MAVGANFSVGKGTLLGAELGSRVGGDVEVGTSTVGAIGVFTICWVGITVGPAVVQAVKIKIIAINGIMCLLTDNIASSI
jgi:hypothetical protein